MVFEQLKGIIVDKLGVEEEKVTLSAKFSEDLGADSLDLFDIVMEIEETFDISVDNEDVSKIVTVEDAVNYINEKQA